MKCRTPFPRPWVRVPGRAHGDAAVHGSGDEDATCWSGRGLRLGHGRRRDVQHRAVKQTPTQIAVHRLCHHGHCLVKTRHPPASRRRGEGVDECSESATPWCRIIVGRNRRSRCRGAVVQHHCGMPKAIARGHGVCLSTWVPHTHTFVVNLLRIFQSTHPTRQPAFFFYT